MFDVLKPKKEKKEKHSAVDTEIRAFFELQASFLHAQRFERERDILFFDISVRRQVCYTLPSLDQGIQPRITGNKPHFVSRVAMECRPDLGFDGGATSTSGSSLHYRVT